MKVILLNSAMMPVPGYYKAFSIPKTLFIKILEEAYEKGNLESYIGYEQNIELIKKWTNGKVEVKLNRKEVEELETGDILLVMKLKYRVKDPSEKGKKEVSEDDFEFLKVEFEKFPEFTT